MVVLKSSVDSLKMKILKKKDQQPKEEKKSQSFSVFIINLFKKIKFYTQTSNTSHSF